jgi:hypothetical protein
LSACTVCKGFEGTLPFHCPGAEVDQFTLNRVWAGEIDFAYGQWTREYNPLWKRMRGRSVQECRSLWEETMAKPSMEREKVLRGY